MNFNELQRGQVTRCRTLTPKILVSVWLLLGSTAAMAHSFTALYVFGDSLSDTRRNPAPSPQYYNGRFCNGPLWVEYLSTQLGLPYNASNNFAVSGSTTSNLLSQIGGLTATTNLRSGLFTVVSGGNDFLQNVDVGVNDAAWNVIVTNAVLNVTNAVGTLYALGAREVIVGNLANLGQIPFFIGTPTGYSNYIDTKVALFNAKLVTALTNVMQQNAGLRIYVQDNNTKLSKLLAAPAAYGLTVVTNGALEDANLADKSFNGPGANYLFWDVIHPTTKVDVLTAAEAFNMVAVQASITHSGTNFSLVVSNLYPGLPYTIQTSTNLTVWSNFETFTATTTNLTVGLTNGSAKNVYYRVGY